MRALRMGCPSGGRSRTDDVPLARGFGTAFGNPSVPRCPSHVPSQDRGFSVVRSVSSRMEAQGCASLEGQGCGLSSDGKCWRLFLLSQNLYGVAAMFGGRGLVNDF